MLCYAILYYVMLCYVILYYAMLCYIILYYIILCYIILCYALLCYIILYYVILYYIMGQDSVIGIATGYGMDGPGIEIRCKRDFPHPSRPALEPTQPPTQWVPGLSRG